MTICFTCIIGWLLLIAGFLTAAALIVFAATFLAEFLTRRAKLPVRVKLILVPIMALVLYFVVPALVSLLV